MLKRLRYASLMSAVMITAVSSFAQTSGNSQLNSEYRRWLDEDVHWIINDQDRNSFLHLTSDAERDHFVVAFWEQRNPTAGSQVNAFKEEHYRRLAFSNQHFAATAPGWKTDRGRTYILYGPPDSISVRSATANTRRAEVWVYRNLPGRAEKTQLKFIDRCQCGDYQLETPLP